MTANNLTEWPSFGVFRYKGRYFRIHHGKSNRQYSDLPSIAIYQLLERLISIEKQSSEYLDFKNKAQEEIEKFNNELPKEIDIPEKMISASLNKYYWGQSDEDETLGLKITVNWKSFFKFIQECSLERKSIWKVSGYIYACRNIFVNRSLKDPQFESNMESYTTQVKKKAAEPLSSVVKDLRDIETTIGNAIAYILNLVKKSNKKPAYLLYTLMYLNELMLKVKTLKSLTQIGDFAACFSEMRRIIEGITTHMFWDQLQLKLIEKGLGGEEMDLMRMFNEGSFKEAREHNLNVQEVSNKKKIFENEMLKLLLKEGSLNTEKTKIFIEKLHEEMSVASYIIIYGKKLSTSPLAKYDEKRLNDSKLSIFNIQEDVKLLKIGSEEIFNALTGAGIISSKSLMDIQDCLNTALKDEKIILIPPSPTLPLRILGHSVLSKETVSELDSMYNEFSPFIHSAWESNTVWPFTSVLEIMTFAENLKRFAQSLDDAVIDFLDFFKAKIDFFLI